MTLGIAVLLFVLAVGGAIVSALCLKTQKTLRTICLWSSLRLPSCWQAISGSPSCFSTPSDTSPRHRKYRKPRAVHLHRPGCFCMFLHIYMSVF